MNTPTTAQTASKIYRRMFNDDLVRDPNSTYWQAHFQAEAKRLLGFMGSKELYTTWFDRRFPGDGESHGYTWQEKFQAASAACGRIQSHLESFRESAVARELNIENQSEQPEQPTPTQNNGEQHATDLD